LDLNNINYSFTQEKRKFYTGEEKEEEGRQQLDPQAMFKAFVVLT